MTTIAARREAWRVNQARRRAKPGVKDLNREARKRRYREEAKTTRARRSNPKTWGKTIIARLRFRAKKCGLDFSVTADDIIVPDVCPVFGVPFEFSTGHNARTAPYTPSVDRIDNTKGYIPGNVRVISLRANMLKSDSTLAEMEKVLAYMKREMQP